MNRTVSMMVITTLLTTIAPPATAGAFDVALSPPASTALNLGTVIYPGDHAPGLSPLNESTMPVSTASGGILGGMAYDDVTNMLSFDVGYGSAFGFSDLQSDWSSGGVHFHGNGTNTAHFPAANTNAGVTISLAAFHTPSGTRSGRIMGSVALTATQETWLLNNQMYLNVHSQQLPGGEIRGQLVPIVPEPSCVLLALIGSAGLLVRRRK